jgi:hypothetical protein
MVNRVLRYLRESRDTYIKVPNMNLSIVPMKTRQPEPPNLQVTHTTGIDQLIG